MNPGASSSAPSDAPDERPAIPVEQEYRRTVDSAGSYRQSVSMLRLMGSETLDFLHRMSTNDLSHLAPGQTRKTIIVNEKGRIIDLVQVCVLSDSVLLIGSPGYATKIRSWLEKFLITEDVTISFASDAITCVSVLGPGSPTVISRMSGGVHPAPPESFMDTRVDERAALIYREERCRLPCYRMVFPDDPSGGGYAEIPDIPHDVIPAPLSRETFETFRIEEGIPAAARELTGDVNALEAGLKKYISFTKGCYIGQEVIARIETYNKLQRLLSLFFLQGDGSRTLFPRGSIRVGEREVGRISSLCYSPRYRGIIGLGYRGRGIGRDGAMFVPENTGETHPVSLLDFTIPGYERYEISDEAH